MIVSWTFLISLILCSLKICKSQDISNLKALRTQLFTTNDYDTRFRPVKDQSDVIDVNIGLELIQLNEIDDLEETMTITAYIRVIWRDEELTWTPSSYGYIDTVFFPQEDIWTPDIAIKNSYGKSNAIGFDSLNAKISDNGMVAWVPYEQLVSTCSLNIRKYPFDKQNCELIFTSWSYSVIHMTISNTSTIDTTDYTDGPSWKLKSTSLTIRTSSYFSPEIVYTLSFERKPTYLVLTVICPIIMLAILDLFVFLVPASSGEKTGYAVTVFLSLAVFLTIVESSMPKNSETVPIFTLYVIILIAQSTIITLISIVLVKCATYDDKRVPVPRILKTLTRLNECQACKKSNNQVANISITFDENIEEKKETIEKDYNMCENDEHKNTWEGVANSLDRLFLILFTFVFVLTTIIFAVFIVT